MSSPSVRQYAAGRGGNSRRKAAKMGGSKPVNVALLSSLDYIPSAYEQKSVDNIDIPTGSQVYESSQDGREKNLQDTSQVLQESKVDQMTATQSSTLRSTTLQNASYDGVLDSRPVSLKMQLCIDILAEGFVDAYIDFYYLSHREQATPEQEAEGIPNLAAYLDDAQLHAISELLCMAETGRRTGDISQVSEAYCDIAERFWNKKDFKTAIYFYKKCLTFCRQSGEKQCEMHICHLLGRAGMDSGDLESARQYHEEHLNIATEIGDTEQQRLVHGELVHVYCQMAEQQEQLSHDDPQTKLKRREDSVQSHDQVENEMNTSPYPSNTRANTRTSSSFSSRESTDRHRDTSAISTTDHLTSALNYYLKSLLAAQECGNRQIEGDANLRVGQIFGQLDRPKESIPYLRSYLSIAQELNNVEAQGRAYGALASIYQQISDNAQEFDRGSQQSSDEHSKAQEYLTEYLRVAENTDDIGGQADACMNLGTVASRQQQFENAVKYFERAYELRRKEVRLYLDVNGDDQSEQDDESDTNKFLPKDKEMRTVLREAEYARLLLGMARGNAKLGAYVNVINCHVDLLLKWKLQRNNASIESKRQC